MRFSRSMRILAVSLSLVGISGGLGASPDSGDVRKPVETPAEQFLGAVDAGDYGTVLSQLRQGMDPNTRDQAGQTALIRAAENGQVKVMTLLLARGARINARDRYGNTALHNATDMGQVQAVRLLLRKGADWRIRNVFHYTALMLTGRVEHPGGDAEYRVIRRLLLARARGNHHDKRHARERWPLRRNQPWAALTPDDFRRGTG